MALADYIDHMNLCLRCSSCKWIPLPQTKSKRFSTGCPSIQYGNFHAYSGGGKVISALGLETGRIDYSEEMQKTVFACSMCGACDISCKFTMADLVAPLPIIQELRIKMVEDGESDLVHAGVIENLRNEDNVFGKPKTDRMKWAEGLNIKDILEEKAEVYFHVGCQFSYDEELWPVIRSAAKILQAAGVDFGIAKKEEVCCGGRSYELGYEGMFQNYAESMVGRVKESGAKILLTCCSDGYGFFQQHYPKIGQTFDGVEIVHITDFIDRLLKAGKIKMTGNVPLRVTYHDPCHLGRLGEPYVPWDGEYKKVLNNMLVTEPEKVIPFGNNGVYDQPRNILKQIPGLEFTEMERIREYSYCCGAGGGAKEAYPDFAMMAAQERLEEAKSTGAEALVTACPWCVRNFRDALKETGENIKVYDILELVAEGMGK